MNIVGNKGVEGELEWGLWRGDCEMGVGIFGVCSGGN